VFEQGAVVTLLLCLDHGIKTLTASTTDRYLFLNLFPDTSYSERLLDEMVE
jgi:hypothetical protein